VTARDAAIAALSPACRARTILAAGTWLPWRTEDGSQHAPYLDQDGTPLLLVERATADELLTAGVVSIESDALPELGVLRLRGSVWPAVRDRQLAALRQFRTEHAACADCCGPLRTSLVGVRVDAVALATGGSTIPVDLDAYVEARPDLVIARSLRVRLHLNTDHADDLLVLVSRLFGRPRDEIAGVAVEWIDTLGLDLAVLDEDGASSVRLPFRVPLASIDDLGCRLHHLLHEAA
jgi:uncharacterized protein DUF2470